MQFDIIGFLIFLGFILPGFVAQKARGSIVPRSLKPLSTVAEVGEFVLAGVWVHLTLIVVLRVVFLEFGTQYFAVLADTFQYGTLRGFLWDYRRLIFSYFVLSLAVGYGVGFLQGWQIIRQPVRSWITDRRLPSRLLEKMGITGFLEEQPVWYFVLKQASRSTVVFLEVEMKNAAGFYTGELRSYGILDDSVKSKDFYLSSVHFKQDRPHPYAPLKCDGILLNFEDVVSIRVVKTQSDITGQAQ